MMNEAATIKFTDLETRDEAVVIVRYDETTLALGLSLKTDGDMEIVMKKEDARLLLEALKKANV